MAPPGRASYEGARPNRRVFRLAALALAIVSLSACSSAASVSAGSSLGPTATRTLSPSTPNTGTEAGAPSVFWAAVAGADGDFWLSGTYRCGTRTCLVVERSTDGGASFVRVGAPGVRMSSTGPDDEGVVSSLQFGNAQDGYILVSQEAGAAAESLYWTGDGGRRWLLSQPSGRLDSPVVVAGGAAYVLLASCLATTSDCVPETLARSSVASNSWTMRSLPHLQRPQHLAIAAFGANVWLVSNRPDGGFPPQLLASDDGGREFTLLRRADLGGLTCAVAAASATVLWGLCAYGLLGQAVRSTDGGRRFVSLSLVTPNPGIVMPVSSTTAVFVVPLRVLLATDDGRRVTALRPSSFFKGTFSIGFAGAATWLALGGTSGVEQAWRTTDAGRSWSQTPLPSLGH